MHPFFLAGDPIEVGAAAMLREGPGSPVALQACKTSVGHTEPAAGAVGVLHAVTAIHTQAAAGILHLRTVRVTMGR